MTLKIMAAIAAFAVLVSVTTADAKKRHYKHRSVATLTTTCTFGNDGKTYCYGTSINAPTAFPMGRRINTAPVNGYDVAVVIGGAPSGCPRRAYCGCATAIKVFGENRRDLWPARAWFRFPRTSPASGMVAVRNHHVFVLESHVGGNNWLSYDPNSGNHLTRRHVRDISGHTIVNPHATRYALQ